MFKRRSIVPLVTEMSGGRTKLVIVYPACNWDYTTRIRKIPGCSVLCGVSAYVETLNSRKHLLPEYGECSSFGMTLQIGKDQLEVSRQFEQELPRLQRLLRSKVDEYVLDKRPKCVVTDDIQLVSDIADGCDFTMILPSLPLQSHVHREDCNLYCHRRGCFDSSGVFLHLISWAEWAKEAAAKIVIAEDGYEAVLKEVGIDA